MNFGKALMDDSTYASRIETTAADPEKQGWSAARGDQLRAARAQPGVDGPCRWFAYRNTAFPGALAKDPYELALSIHVTDIEPAEFAHANPRGVQRFEHGTIPKGARGAVVDIGEKRRDVF